MSKLKKLINEIDELNLDLEVALSKESYDYFQKILEGKVSDDKLTENGKKIIGFFKGKYKNSSKIEAFSAKVIAEDLFTTSRSVSGSMRKLVSSGFVEKIGADPVTYQITESGLELPL